jgi:hypothetical protein
MATTPDMGQLSRKHLLHFIDANFNKSETPNWFLIGKDIEDLSVSLNPDVQTKKNILDETVAEDNGYEPSIDADTYYANTNDAIYSKLKEIAMNRLTGDACKTRILEVMVDNKNGPYDAWMEDIVVKPQSYGGASGHINIPYNISFDGNRKQGTVTITDKKPTFTETTTETTEE